MPKPEALTEAKHWMPKPSRAEALQVFKHDFDGQILPGTNPFRKEERYLSHRLFSSPQLWAADCLMGEID